MGLLKRNVKRSLSIIISASMIMSSMGVGFSENLKKFSDIENHWAKTQIQKLVKKGVISGYSDGTFKPNKQITRAEFITLINKAYNFKLVYDIDFKDVSPDDWFYEEIRKAKAKGYISGYEDNTIRPNDLITRQEVAVIMDKVLKISITDKSQVLNKFKDKDEIAGWAKTSVELLVSRGYLNGYPDETFGPKKNITRAEAAAMLDKVFKYLNDEKVKKLDLKENAKKTKSHISKGSKIHKVDKDSKSSCTTTVDIPSDTLRKVINKTLGEDRDPKSDITKEEMESIKELSSSYLELIKNGEEEVHRGISNIDGLQYAINLEKLDLSENKISDLTPLKDLKKLNYLELDRNDIKDLTPLSGLVNLEHLNIYNNAGIIDVTPITGLTKLKWIDMHYCNRRTAPVNVEKLESLVNLEFLSIDDNFVEDVSFTKNLLKLSTFSCNNNYVTDLNPVQDLAVASYNDWSGERFFNMFGQMLKKPVKVRAGSEGTVYKMSSPVTGNELYAKKVEEVAKMDGEDVQVPAIKVCDGDENYISVSYNHETDEIELTIDKNETEKERSAQTKIMLDYGMYSLKVTFDITQEAIVDKDSKASCTTNVDIPSDTLRKVINHKLGKDRDSKSDITKEEMESIKELSSDYLEFIKNGEDEPYRGINNIEGLQYAINLEKLDLSENKISDLTPLKDLKKLSYMELDRNDIKDLTPLSGLENLEHLNIYNNAGIIDVTPITGLTKLKWIDMHYCNRRTAPVNVEKLESLVNLEFLSIDDNFVEDVSFTKNMLKLSTFSCNNNYVTDLSPVQDLAVVSYNDWSGERFFNMFGQMLKKPVKVRAGSEGTVYKMPSPVTGNELYEKKVEEYLASCGENVQVPAIKVCDGDENYISVSYNHETDEIELTVDKNKTEKERSAQTKIILNYGMYSLKVTFDITQEATDIIVSPKADFEFFNGKITGYNGTETDIVIPSTIGGKEVTSIGKKAFAKSGRSETLVSFPPKNRT